MRWIVLVVLAAFAFGVAASEESAPKENWFKRAGKAIGKDAKEGWREAKEGYKKGGKQIGHDTANATKRVGHEMKDSAKRTRKAAKKEFK